MTHCPVCVKCGRELRPKKNQVICLDMMDTYGTERTPYQMWEADLWRCPDCGIEILTGFGHIPISMHYEEGFYETLKAFRENSLVIENRMTE